METGVESNAEGAVQRGSQAVMWQIRNPHTPKRKKELYTTPPPLNCLQNQNATKSNAPQTQTTKHNVLPRLLVVVETRRLYSNF